MTARVSLKLLPSNVGSGNELTALGLAELLSLENYVDKPVDGKVVAWPTDRTDPDREGEKPDIEFTIQAQVLRETEEGREARLKREEEERQKEEERLREEEEARLREAEEDRSKEEDAKQGEGGETARGEESPETTAEAAEESVTGSDTAKDEL